MNVLHDDTNEGGAKKPVELFDLQSVRASFPVHFSGGLSAQCFYPKLALSLDAIRLAEETFLVSGQTGLPAFDHAIDTILAAKLEWDVTFAGEPVALTREFLEDHIPLALDVFMALAPEICPAVYHAVESAKAEAAKRERTRSARERLSALLGPPIKLSTGIWPGGAA